MMRYRLFLCIVLAAHDLEVGKGTGLTNGNSMCRRILNDQVGERSRTLESIISSQHHRCTSLRTGARKENENVLNEWVRFGGTTAGSLSIPVNCEV